MSTHYTHTSVMTPLTWALKEIVHLRKMLSLILTLQFFIVLSKQKLAVIILLHSFVINIFIKTMNRSTQLHQPITFDCFEHQPFTEEMDKTRKRSKQFSSRKMQISSVRKCFQANDSKLTSYFARATIWLSQFKTPCWRWTISFKQLKTFF